jgi:hypothetical protein
MASKLPRLPQDLQVIVLKNANEAITDKDFEVNRQSPRAFVLPEGAQ